MDSVKIFFDLLARTKGEADIDRLGKKIADAGDDAKKSSGKFKTLAEGTRALGEDMERARAHVAGLHKEFARTGDMTLLKDIRKAERDLKNLEGWAKYLAGPVKEATFSLGRLGGEMSNFGKGPAIGVAAAAGAVAAIPALATVAGAAVAGLGLGFIGLGAFAVKESHRVQAAATDLKTTWVSAVQRAGHATQSDFVRALNTLEGTAKRVEPSLTRVFANVTPSAVNLARGVDQLAKNAMPGLERAGIASAGVLNRLEPVLGDTGAAVGSFGDSLAEAAEGGGAALVDMLGVLNNSIRTTGNSLEGASKAYQFLMKDPGWHKWLPPVAIGRAYNDWATGVDATTTAAKASEQGFSSLSATTNMSKAAVEAHERANFNLAASMLNVSNMALASAGSEIAAVDARIRAKEVLQEGTKTLNIATDAGRRNKEVILEEVAAAIRWGESETKRTGNSNIGAAATKRHTDAMYADAVAVLRDKGAVDRLWASLGLLPPSKTTRVAVSGAVQAELQIRAVKRTADAIERAININIGVSGYSAAIANLNQLSARARAGVGAATGGLIRGYAAGGFHGHVLGAGTSTSDSIPAMLSDGEYVIKASSVKQIGIPLLDRLNAVGMAAGGPVGMAAGGKVPQAKLMTTPTQIWANAARLAKLVQDAFSGKREGSLLSLVTRDSKALSSLANQRASTVKRLGDAQKRLSDLTKASMDTKQSTIDKVMGTFSLTGGGASETADGIIGRLTSSVLGARQFADRIAVLRKRGLAGGLLQQLADAGPEAGNAAALALVRSGGGEFAQINHLYKQLGSSANSTGLAVSEALYGAGIRGAQGLVKGLASQQKAIEAQMLAIAKAMQAAIKRALGIRSPSAVMAGLGAQVPAGFAQGIASGHGQVASAAERMALAAARSVGVSGGGRGGGVTIENLHVHAAAGTNARQIGAELMGYLRAYEKGGGGVPWVPKT